MNSKSSQLENQPGQPEYLSATIGELKGEIDLQWDPVEGANSYVIEFSKNKKLNWEQADIVSLSKHTVTHLKTKVTYCFRIAAINGDGQGPWSEVVSKNI